MGESCIFDSIITKESPATIEYEDADVIAFRDINPKREIHILVVPKKHIPTVSDMTEEDFPLLGKMIFAAKKIADKFKLTESGYKLLFNVGKAGGQIVPHIHLHLLGGKAIAPLEKI